MGDLDGRRERRPRGDEPDGRPAAGRAVDLDLAAVQVHDLLHDRQPEPRARRLRGVERQEDLLAVLPLDAPPVVGDLDHPPAAPPPHPHPPPPPPPPPPPLPPLLPPPAP